MVKVGFGTSEDEVRCGPHNGSPSGVVAPAAEFVMHIASRVHA